MRSLHPFWGRDDRRAMSENRNECDRVRTVTDLELIDPELARVWVYDIVDVVHDL